MDTVGRSPSAVPHEPPTEVTGVFVLYGNVRAVPFTVVTLTTGGAVSTTMFWGPVVPVLPATSVCVIVSVYVPPAASGGVSAYDQLPPVHCAVPFCVAAPVTAIETLGVSPVAIPQAPPTDA